MAGYDPVESRKLVAASWARAEAQLDAVRTAFHAKLQEIDKTAAKLFAGTCRNVPAPCPLSCAACLARPLTPGCRFSAPQIKCKKSGPERRFSTCCV